MTFFAFLGPNGAGKTTTISILTTTLFQNAGSVTIAGYDVEKQAKHVREKVGIIFQQPSLDPNLTAEENIRFHACPVWDVQLPSLIPHDARRIQKPRDGAC